MDEWVKAAMELGATEAGWLDTAQVRFLRRLWKELGMSTRLRPGGGMRRTGEKLPARACVYLCSPDGGPFRLRSDREGR